MIVPHSALQTVKYWLVVHAGLAKDALHVYVGLGLFLEYVFLAEHDRAAGADDQSVRALGPGV